ncbi:MAG TPA: DUF3524 domain-containing protein [Tepidisphaeraceae bacterium]|jgi:hypothetical protein|nr:DUF3524 domain-containing protein [Tepidisphaeraceae bacterium]
MSSQLDILALEPFYGGARRVMLETVMRYSRHRWTLLKLPPRRIERRLSVAAHWFAEQLQRHWSGKIDLVFTSEALNLADLLRLVPKLSKKPTIAYFHDNQLPDVTATGSQPLDFVNINTASVADEVWFNSVFHLKTFLARANALLARHPEYAALSPMATLAGKVHVMPPSIDTGDIQQHRKGALMPRPTRSIFVDTRDADVRLLNAAIGMLQRRGEKFDLTTIGPVDGLDPSLERRTLPEQDHHAHVQALFASGVYLSSKPGAMSDFHAIRALSAGCWPVFPRGGVYPELLPPTIHSSCLFEPVAERMASRMQDAWYLERPDGYQLQLTELLKRFDPVTACRAMDQRLEETAVRHVVSK